MPDLYYAQIPEETRWLFHVHNLSYTRDSVDDIQIHWEADGSETATMWWPDMPIRVVVPNYVVQYLTIETATYSRRCDISHLTSTQTLVLSTKKQGYAFAPTVQRVILPIKTTNSARLELTIHPTKWGSCLCPKTYWLREPTHPV